MLCIHALLYCGSLYFALNISAMRCVIIENGILRYVVYNVMLTILRVFIDHSIIRIMTQSLRFGKLWNVHRVAIQWWMLYSLKPWSQYRMALMYKVLGYMALILKYVTCPSSQADIWSTDTVCISFGLSVLRTGSTYYKHRLRNGNITNTITTTIIHTITHKYTQL